MLQLSLIGPPLVTRDGSPVGFDTRKAVALLAVLAVEAKPQPRDRLAALLWPGSDAAKARSALRRTLSVTAAAVGDAVTIDRNVLALAPERCASDVGDFRRLLAAGDPGSLRTAATLYRDDFLAGFALRDSAEFEDWQSRTADALRRDLGRVLGALVDAGIAAGDLDAAVADAERWLALDPLHEPTHHALIRLYAWRGQRSAAMRQYRTCVRVLGEELGVEPLAATTQLYDAVRRNLLPPPEVIAAPPALEATAEREPGPRVRLVGRDTELATLRAAFGGEPRGLVVVVSGPTGVGKTALLRAVERLRPADGASASPTTVATRCHPEEASLAFCAAIELARGLLAAVPDAVDRLPRHVRAELARLLPETAQLDGAAAGGDDPAAAARLFGAVRELVLAVGGPVSLVVDDAQWLDPASGDLLAYLVRRIAGTTLTLVLAWATDAAAEPSAVVRAAADAAEDGNGLELRLRPLDGRALAELVAGDAALAAAGIDLERLLADTGGLPSLVTASLDAVRRGEDPAAGAEVRDALTRRVSRLSETAQQVLAAAAVLGGRVDPDVVRETSGRGDAETVAAVEEAVRAGLLVEVSGGDGYDVPFESLRRVVMDSMTLARRRLLHQRSAHALIRRVGGSGRLTPADAGAIAWHLQEAGSSDEAAEWHWRAAKEARALHAHDEALEEVRAALALGFSATTGRIAEGEILIALGRYREALDALERAAAVVPSGTAAVRVERRLADVHHRLGDYAVADAHLAAALDALADDDDVETAAVLAERALLAYRQDALDEAQAYGDAALAAARRSDDAESLASARNVLGVIAAGRGDLAAAETLFRQSLSLDTSAGDPADGSDPSAAIAALNNLARLLEQTGRSAEALQTAEEALARGARLGDRHRVAALHTNLADLLRSAGQHERSMEHLKQAAALFADVDDDQQRRPEIWKLVEW